MRYILRIKKQADKTKIVKELENLVIKEMSLKPIILTHFTSELIEMLGMESELKEKRIVDFRPKK